MMIAVLQGETDKKGEEIYCTVPKGLDLTGCALKLFVLSEAYAPDARSNSFCSANNQKKERPTGRSFLQANAGRAQKTACKITSVRV